MTLTEQLLEAADVIEQLAAAGNFHAVVIRRAILADAVEQAPMYIQHHLEQLLEEPWP